jgi:hypothetical protein
MIDELGVEVNPLTICFVNRLGFARTDRNIATRNTHVGISTQTMERAYSNHGETTLTLFSLYLYAVD